ncbi:7395_t:CDS:2 [Funneliformis geosporum]|uniref:7395_t:CDS:1 n=1 Tax=Funneliformis geosporum TaxID=1117311 RepID=A0A9W4X6P9_9GLOM|nr:7395_t:CDS:2 [Funneliformis geosporum]
MNTSFNCYILILSIDDSETILVNIYKDNKNKRYFQSDKAKIILANFKVSHLKKHICNIYGIKKVDQYDVTHKLEGRKIRDHDLFNVYFKVELADHNKIEMGNIYIIAIIPTIVTPATVSLFQQGVPLELKRHDENQKPKEKRYDKQLHHIPILANGPGTGKSRFLQELLTLLEQHRNHNEHVLGNSQILAINITFNIVINASNEDTSSGSALVALQILYEYFISGSETLYFNEFKRMCGKNWKTFEIATACDIVLKDIGGNIGSLERFIQESIYDLLRLPLHLLSDEEVEKITLCMKENQELAGYINYNKTFQRFISDIGEQI